MQTIVFYSASIDGTGEPEIAYTEASLTASREKAVPAIGKFEGILESAIVDLVPGTGERLAATVGKRYRQKYVLTFTIDGNGTGTLNGYRFDSALAALSALDTVYGGTVIPVEDKYIVLLVDDTLPGIEPDYTITGTVQFIGNDNRSKAIRVYDSILAGTG